MPSFYKSPSYLLQELLSLFPFAIILPYFFSIPFICPVYDDLSLSPLTSFGKQAPICFYMRRAKENTSPATSLFLKSLRTASARTHTPQTHTHHTHTTHTHTHTPHTHHTHTHTHPTHTPPTHHTTTHTYKHTLYFAHTINSVFCLITSTIYR